MTDTPPIVARLRRFARCETPGVAFNTAEFEHAADTIMALLEALEGWLPIAERQFASLPPAPESKAWNYAKERLEKSRAAIAKAREPS